MKKRSLVGAFALAVSFPTSQSHSPAHHRAPRVFAAFTTSPLRFPCRRFVPHNVFAFPWLSSYWLIVVVGLVVVAGPHLAALPMSRIPGHEYSTDAVQ